MVVFVIDSFLATAILPARDEVSMFKKIGWLVAFVLILSLCCVRSPGDVSSKPVSVSKPKRASDRIYLATDDVADAEFLRSSVRNHPMPEVSGILWSKIETGEIGIRWMGRSGADASFRPMSVYRADGTLERVDGTVFFSRETIVLARAGIPDAVAYVQMLLLHESIHYEQIAEERFSPEVITRAPNTPEDCEIGWNLEREAYKRECEFAKVTGTDGILPFCSSLEAAAFDRALFNEMAHGRQDMCPAVWKKRLRS